MSWSRAVSGPLRILVAGTAVLGLGGCLQPMYTTVGGNLGGELRAIAVDPVPERLGHYLQDALITDLNGTGASVAPKYHLTVTPAERVQTALVDIVSQRAQNADVITDVSFVLTPVGGAAPIAAGTVSSAAAYDRSAQRYANIRAARDAEIRDAKTVADQITTRIAAALANPNHPNPAIPPTGDDAPSAGAAPGAVTSSSTLPLRAAPLTGSTEQADQ